LTASMRAHWAHLTTMEGGACTRTLSGMGTCRERETGGEGSLEGRGGLGRGAHLKKGLTVGSLAGYADAELLQAGAGGVETPRAEGVEQGHQAGAAALLAGREALHELWKVILNAARVSRGHIQGCRGEATW
jgi:hypothetical protein